MSRFSSAGRCCLAVLLAGTSGCWASESLDADWSRSADPALAQPLQTTASIDSSIAALQLAQQQAPAGGETLLAPLRDLAYALARAGYHRESIPHLEMAVSIVRAHYGVFDLRQIDLLKQLAASLTALGREEEAQEHMLYMVRASEKVHGAPDRRVVPAYCDLGDWFARIGKFRESRMAYQVALNIVDATAASDNLDAVDPLLGFSASYMRQLSHPEPVSRDRLPSVFRGINVPKPEVFLRDLSESAEHSLETALRILDENPDAAAGQWIDALVQTGDWFQIKKAPARALPYYQRAWKLIETETGEPSPRSRLDLAVRVYYPTPLVAARTAWMEQTELQHVQLEFTVQADGSVADARIVEHDSLDKYAADTLQAIRQARFRPRFIDGIPVTTAGMTYRQVLRVGKSAH